MATFTKQALSGSTNGKQILVTVTTVGAAQTIHTAVAGTSSFDEIWLYAYNDATVPETLTILWGGVSEPADHIVITLQAQAGRVLVVDGKILQNTLIVKAYASIASKITIDGFVNNIA